MNHYPFRFEPIFQTYLWGGRRLGTELNKPIGDGPNYAESWELVDHGNFQSVVKAGVHAGKTLGKLVEELGSELLGDKTQKMIHAPGRPENLVGRFPLLFKFLDAKQDLSVQVHPDDQLGGRLNPPDLGKTEAWYVMDADPGARIYAGLQSGVSQVDLQKAIDSNTAESVLNSWEAHAGDCVYIPAGTVHALGKGLLIAEIQQCSNTTFRLYDWGRVDKNGIPRELNIDQGIEATDFELGPVQSLLPRQIDSFTDSLVNCDKFKMNRLRLTENHLLDTRGSFKILAVIDGSVALENDPCNSPLRRGDTCLIAAGMETLELRVPESADLLSISPD